MVNCFKSLRHNTVICSNNKNNDIGNLSTASTHHSECFVTRSIKEGDFSLLCRNLICTDLLSNTARFSCNHVCVTDCIKSLCLTVVNVTHNGNNRRTRTNTFFVSGIAFDNGFVIQAYQVNFTVIFRSKNGCSITVNALVDGYHHTHAHQFCNDFICFKIHLLCKICNCDGFKNINLFGNRTCGFNRLLAVLIQFFFVECLFLIFSVVNLLFAFKCFLCRSFVSGKLRRITVCGTWSACGTERACSGSTVCTKATLTSLSKATALATLSAHITLTVTTLSALSKTAALTILSKAAALTALSTLTVTAAVFAVAVTFTGLCTGKR